MVQQNKRPRTALDERRTQLETDLIGEDLTPTAEIETGRRHVYEKSQFQSNANRLDRRFQQQQGFRRRHPDRVLGQYDGIMKTTGKSASLWEKAMIHETERHEMPQEFRPTDDSEGMTNQVGLVTTALLNYKASKEKFSRMYLVGV